jgi:hypothetical protein
MPLSTIFNAILVLDTSNPKANQNRAVICTWDDVTEESRNNHRLKRALDAQPQVCNLHQKLNHLQKRNESHQ